MSQEKIHVLAQTNCIQFFSFIAILALVSTDESKELTTAKIVNSLGL